MDQRHSICWPEVLPDNTREGVAIQAAQIFHCAPMIAQLLNIPCRRAAGAKPIPVNSMGIDPLSGCSFLSAVPAQAGKNYGMRPPNSLQHGS